MSDLSNYSSIEFQEQLMKVLEEMELENQQLQKENQEKDLMLSQALDKAEELKILSEQSISLSEIQEMIFLVEEQTKEIKRLRKEYQSLETQYLLQAKMLQEWISEK